MYTSVCVCVCKCVCVFMCASVCVGLFCAQIQALLAALRATREDSGNTAKSVVFSQFTTFLDMLEIALAQNGFQVCVCVCLYVYLHMRG
jgi:SNF2 family DNA or RNA helicase